jgi:hypothetical protein
LTNYRHALQLLEQANPVPGSALETLIPLAEAIRPTLIAAEPTPGERRRVSRLRLGLTALALAVAFVLVAPALGLDLPALDFWTAEKAPPRIVEDFDSLAEGAPPGMDPGAVPGEARKVMTVVLDDGRHTLWVAPTRSGGFCVNWTKSGGGCDKLGTVPLSVSWSARGPIHLSKGGIPDVTPTSFNRLSGHVNSEYAEAVEIRFVDGEVVRPDVAWVSEPIGAGFFIYDIPELHRTPGHEISAVVALDGGGNIVAEDRGRPRESTGRPPVEAVMDDRHAVARIGTRQGEATIWEAPTRYEGRCAWLDFAGRSLAFVPCMPKLYSYGNFAFRFVPTERTVLLVGSVEESVASVELRFADGDRVVVHPQGGFVLYELPSEHLVRGREATSLTSRDITGKALHPPFTVNGLGGSRFECLAPLPLEGDRSGPFCP